MAMSSYMVNSKYVDPKFPPCEEYLQNNYLAEQGSDYYGSTTQGSDFQHQGIYPRSNYGEQPFSCSSSNAQSSTLPRRGHGQEESGPASLFSGQAEPPMPPSRACSQQQPNLKSSTGSPAAAIKQPAVVYPWMKKVHVNSGKQSSSTSSSPLFLLPTRMG